MAHIPAVDIAFPGGPHIVSVIVGGGQPLAKQSEKGIENGGLKA